MWWRSGIVCGLTLLFAACTNKSTDIKSVPVMTINGDAITASRYGNALAKKLKMYDALAAKDPTNIKRARESVIKEFIVSTLLSQYAKAHDLSVGEGELLQQFDQVRKTYPDDLTFKAALATEGTSINEWKAALKQTLIERKAFAYLDPPTALSEKEDEKAAHQLYELNKDAYVRPAQIRVEQIVVPREDDAERLLHKLKTGTAFSSLAQKFSTSPDSSQGGDIGFIAKGVMPAFDSVFNQPVGYVSGIVKSTYGFHIVKVLDKRPAGHLTFEQVKSRLMREAAEKRQQDIFNNWLESAVKSAKIERNDSLLEKVRVRTEGAQE
jgi:peptidyl-prolyl cis-trans isomerase C